MHVVRSCMLLSHLSIFLIIVHCHAEIISYSSQWSSSLSTSCANILIRNVSYGQIHSLNFYHGQSQPPNTTCSWTIYNSQPPSWSNYIISIRVLELENDPTRWSNEISFWTGNRQISLDDINKRTYLISTSSSSIQIYSRSKAPLLQNYNPYIRTNLRVRRFLIEFLYINPPTANKNYDQYFHCTSSDILIPKQWRCNCIHECSYGDQSDENGCPLCSMYELSTSLLCQSNEIWCLPSAISLSNETATDFDNEENIWMQTHRQYSEQIDPKGVCLPMGQDRTCRYSTNKSRCQVVLVRRQDNGHIVVDKATANIYETICFVIIAKEEHKIKILLNSYSIGERLSDFEWTIYDGSENQSQLLASSNNIPIKQTVQTRQHHIATIVIRRPLFKSIDNLIHSYVDDDTFDRVNTQEQPKRFRRSDINSIFFNVTWLTSICPDDQMLCSGRFETKCFTAEQRCDGVWDCISGDDEVGCSPESCPTTFACNEHSHLPSDLPRCFTWSERCNGNSFCANRTDEKFCTNWWCNSNNGTFLCKNLNCIYEAWVCDGADDCGDHSDEINCSTRVPRRIVTAAVIGATICSTLFIIALGCTCKLFHLRTSERRTASCLLNPQRYIEQRRRYYQREHERRSQHRPENVVQPASDSRPTVLNETRRIAPPSYNQTMGLTDENEERHAALTEHLRLAGLANYISVPSSHTGSRMSRSVSRHRHRRHRRHRHHHHHHHHRRAHSESSRVALLEPTVVVSNAAFTQPSTTFPLNGFNRIRSQLRSIFSTMTRNPRVPMPCTTSVPARSETHERRHRTRATSTQTLEQPSRGFRVQDFMHTCEPPPPYTEEVPNSSSSNESTRTIITPVTTASMAMCEGNSSRRNSSDASDIDSNNSTSMYRLRKREVPIHTLRDRMRQFISGPPSCPVTEEYSHPMQPTSMTTTIRLSRPETPIGTSSSISDENQEMRIRTTPSTAIGNIEQPINIDDDKI